MEVAQPWSEVAQPRVEVAQPWSEVAQPRVKVAQPWSEVAQARAKVAHPNKVSLCYVSNNQLDLLFLNKKLFEYTILPIPFRMHDWYDKMLGTIKSINELPTIYDCSRAIRSKLTPYNERDFVCDRNFVIMELLKM